MKHCCYILLIFQFFEFTSLQVFAQQNKFLDSTTLKVTYKDSLLADDKSSFLYNHVVIKNTSNANINFTYTILPPFGWGIISKSTEEIVLLPNEIFNLNITLSRQKNAEANWKQGKIIIQIKNTLDTSVYYFVAKTLAITNFRARPVMEDIELQPKTTTAMLPIRLLNSGNIAQQFTLNYASEKLELFKNIQLTLNPGKDTLYNFPFNTTKQLAKQILQEDIFLTIRNKENKINVYSYKITQIVSYRKIHKSAYETFPLLFESGILVFNKKYTGYFGLNGRYLLKDSGLLIFNYRSKQFGIADIEKSTVDISYQRKKWFYHIGQISQNSNFLSYGKGITVNYDKNEFTQASFYFINNTQSFIKGINFGIACKYPLKKSLIEQELEVNFDKILKKNSIIQKNKLHLFATNKLNLTIDAGLGYSYGNQQSKKQIASGVGFTVGYRYSQYLTSKFYVNSNIDYNSMLFPGNTQGQHIQLHNFKWLLSKNSYLGGQFQLSYFKRIIYRDSILFKSLLLSNNKQLGIIMGFLLAKKVSVNYGFGLMKNSVNAYAKAPNFIFGNMGINFRFLKSLNFSTDITAANNAHYGYLNQHVFLYTSNANLNFKYGGIQVLYDKLPIYGVVNEKNYFRFYEHTLNIGPYLNTAFFKNKLQVKFQYNFSKNSSDSIQLQNGGFSISYLNFKKNLLLQFTSSTTINSVINYKFGMFNLQKTFFVPKPKPPIFYDLKLCVFFDENSNNIFDKNETILPSVKLLIDKIPYSTNAKGYITIANANKGLYNIDLTTASDLKGLIPANGYKQVINLSHKNIQYIPFKKGKYISGNVTVSLDSTSSQKFSAYGLKVIVTDSSGEQHSTLVNSKGKFNISIPSGKYVVSLNPNAFDEKFKPKQFAFTVDLTVKNEIEVNFEIIQRQRKIIKVKSALDN
jgi:hypothetical protein